MAMIKDLIFLALGTAPSFPGRVTPMSYFLLNLLVPVVLGAILAGVTHRLEKILLRLIREKR
jgi:hypothetical protein